MRVFLSGVVLSSLLIGQSAQALMCTKTYAQVQPGMTAAQVKAACGEPKSIQKKRETAFVSESIEYWRYTGNSPSDHGSATADLGYASQPVPAKSFTFDKDGRVSSISVGGHSLSSTSACGGTIRVGDSKNTVMGNCGDPNSRTRGEKRRAQGGIEKEIWTYQFDQYRPAVLLTFEKGVLTHVQE